MESGQHLSLWAIRLAVVAWFGFACTVIVNRKGNADWRWSRLWWTTATILYLIHVLTAFAFYHQWSHADATSHTAEITRRVTGIDWGGGIWFNHLFTLTCVIETITWWARPQAIIQRGRGMNRVIYGYCLFIGFNASVVFVTGWLRWICLGMFICLGIMQLRTGRQK